jgi:uncharacterized protein (DUF1778 family)
MKYSEGKRERIEVRLKAEEKKAAIKKAQDKGQSLCTFIRESIAKNK